MWDAFINHLHIASEDDEQDFVAMAVTYPTK